MGQGLPLLSLLLLRNPIFAEPLAGLAGLVGLSLFFFGLLDRYVLNKQLPAMPHPKLVATAWWLLGIWLLCGILTGLILPLLQVKRSPPAPQGQEGQTEPGKVASYKNAPWGLLP